MTEQPWTDITIHRLDQAISIRVQAATPAEAAEALDPYVAPDVILSGPYTSRTQAVEAILQERRIAAAADLERATIAHQAALTDLHRLAMETEPIQGEPGQAPADVG